MSGVLKFIMTLDDIEQSNGQNEIRICTIR
jgi:hypothetical protein